MQLNVTTSLFQGILNASPDAITVFEAVRTPNGQLIDLRVALINEQSARLFGRSVEAAVGQLYSEQPADPTRQERLNYLRQVLETGEPFERELLAISLTGELFWLRAAFRRFEDCAVVTYTDITEQKRVEQQRNQQVQTLAGVLEALNHGVTVIRALRDETGQVIDFQIEQTNNSTLRDIGLPREQFVGQRIRTLFPGVTQSRVWAAYLDVLATGQPQQLEEYNNYDGLDDYVLNEVVRLDENRLVSSHRLLNDLRRTERALQAQVSTFEGIMRSLLNGLVVFRVVRDADGRLADLYYEAVSDSVMRDTGLTREELVEHSLLALFPGVRQSRYWPAYEAVLATGEPQQFEDHYHYDGIDNYTYAQITPIGSDRLLSVYQLTNDLKMAQIMAHQQADLLQSVIDATPMGLILADPVYDDRGVITDFIYRLTNPFNANLVGKTVDGMIGRPIGTLFPDWQCLELFRGMKAVCETGVAGQHTERLTDYGLDCWLEYHYHRHGQGVLVTFLDVTTLKEAELEQQRQTDLLQSVLDNSPAGLVWLEAVRDETGQLMDFVYKLTNPANASTTGRTVGGMTGKRWLELFPHFKGTQVERLFRDVVESGQPRQSTFEAEHDGQKRWVEGSLVKQDDGVLFVFLDITVLKEAQLEQERQALALEAANRELRRSNENLQSFAYVASHDLQEPLRKIQSFGSLLLQQYAPQLDDEGQRHLGRMQAAASRMSLLIKDLLTFSRLATQQAPFHTVNLSELVVQVLDDLEVAVREAGAQVNLSELPTVMGDPGQLRQLFQNLLSNAIKFHQPGLPPVVGITSRSVHDGDLPADVHQTLVAGTSCRRAYYEISVSDNGIGFDNKYRDRIFGVFQRLHGKDRYSGTGVGLSITRRVTENHGGTIVADGQPGAGALFRVYLPC